MNTRELKMSDQALLRERDRQLAAKRQRSRRVAPRKAPRVAAEKAAREAKRDRTAEVRAACAERARGRCEACNDWRGTYLEMDHFWGRAREESVEACWMLCSRCHHEKTDNHPRRMTWLWMFESHARLHGYATQAGKVEAAIALEAAQHPGPTARRDGDRR